MGLLDHQLMFGIESVYGTAVTPTRTYEFNSESIAESYGRTEGDPLRAGNYTLRDDRFTPYFEGAAGSIQFDVMHKGFSVLFEHALGSTAVSGPTDSAYTHTATMGSLIGKSLTAQLGKPFNPSGTVQPFTYEGGKITEFTLSNSVDGNLLLDLGLDFEQVATGTALATASYPAAMQNLTWAGGAITVGGTDVGIVVSEASVTVNNNMNVDRRSISGGTDKKEPTSGRRSVEFSLSGDFTALTHRNRAASLTQAGALAAIVLTWTAPTLIGVSTYPKLTVTIPAGRFDEWSAPLSGPDAITQELSGVGLFNGSASPITIAVVTDSANG